MRLRYVVPTLGLLAVTAAPAMAADVGGLNVAGYVDTILELSSGDEAILEDGSIRVVADTGSALFLDGLEIDYSDDLVTSGFRFRNPNAVKSCGCGSSFGA